MAGHGHIQNVALDDADPQKRNEALIIENEVLKEELETRDGVEDELLRILRVSRGVQEMGIVKPEEVRKLYTAIEVAIEAFLGPMDQAIRQSRQQKDTIMKSLNISTSFSAFRIVLGGDSEIKNAALDPYTNIIDIWTAYIWRILKARVFRKAAVATFYNGPGQNASYHMKHVDEIDDLMKQANPPVFGEYARRLWRRQALAAIFRTAKFDWVKQRRTASIHVLSQQILDSFNGFSGPIHRDQRLGLVQNIVTAAVRLNEHMMIEADDIWTIEMGGLTGGDQGDFYTRIKDFDLKPVGTTLALRENAPLDTISDRLNEQDLTNRVKPLCTVAPALRWRHINPDGDDYGDTVDLVKPRVLVSLKQAEPERGAPAAPAAAPPDEVIFYTLAQQI